MRNFTTLDQCYILEKLGVDPNSADCFILWTGEKENRRVVEIHIIPEGKTYTDVEKEYSSCKPAWSAYALLKLLPNSIKVWNDDAGRYGANVIYLLEYQPNEYIRYRHENDIIISRPIENIISEIVLILCTIKKLTKTL